MQKQKCRYDYFFDHDDEPINSEIDQEGNVCQEKICNRCADDQFLKQMFMEFLDFGDKAYRMTYRMLPKRLMNDSDIIREINRNYRHNGNDWDYI